MQRNLRARERSKNQTNKYEKLNKKKKLNKYEKLESLQENLRARERSKNLLHHGEMLPAMIVIFGDDGGDSHHLMLKISPSSKKSLNRAN